MEIAQAVRAVLRRDYGIEGDVASFRGEHDLNFEVAAASGRFVFKAMREGCDPRFVKMQVAAMEHPTDSGLADYVQQVIRAPEA